MNYKQMRDYSHEEFVELVEKMNEEELKSLVQSMEDTLCYLECL